MKHNFSKSSDNGRKFLSAFLRIAPLSHALWRSVEALAYETVEYKKPVLDIGCGWGEFAGVVFNRLEMGIDINESELKDALNGKRYKKVLWADGRKLPFKDNSYSTVVSVSVLEHINNSSQVLTEVYRILKPGGVFAFSVPTPAMKDNLLGVKIMRSLGFNKLADFYFEQHCKVFKHVTLRPASWWEEKLMGNGFQIITKTGTISPTVLKLHEVFLISALPSQLWKIIFKKRLIISVGLRAAILPTIFSRFVKIDRNSEINMFYYCKKYE